MDPHVAVSSPSYISELPQELSDKILDGVGLDVVTLRNCSLVCRAWLPRSTSNLFECARVYLRPVEDHADSQVMQAVRLPGRLHDNVVNLAFCGMSFEEWRVVLELPRLREVTVYCCHKCQLPTATAAPVPEPLSSTRSIEVLDIKCVPLNVLDWILQMFSSIDTLRLRHITSRFAVPSAARHVVRSLSLWDIGPAAFYYLANTLRLEALESLAIDVSGSYDPDDGHGPLAAAFVKQVGRGIKSYHHIDRKPIFHTLDLPSLSGCESLTSVTLSTGALNALHFRSKHARVIECLRSLPPNIEHVKLLYMSHWNSAGELAELVGQCDWGTLGAVLLQYGCLVRLEIGAVHIQRWPSCPRFEDDPGLSEEIRQKLPERLRDMVDFV